MMCIVIDANSLSCVFKEDNAKHDDFKPVLDWIIVGKGKIVYGGTSYQQELEKAYRFLKIFMELTKVNKIVPVDNAAVDAKEKEYKKLVMHPDFDDAHIVAILNVSGAKLICTSEKRAIPFLTNVKFYPKGKRPKVYSSKKNAKKLLCDNNIADCCKPAQKLNKSTCENLGFMTRDNDRPLN